MIVPVMFSLALLHHRRAVEEVVGRIRRGRSRVKDQLPECFTWEYSWSVSAHEPWSTGSFEERLADYLPRVRTALVARHGRTSWCGTMNLGCPDEVRRVVIRDIRERMKEEDRVAALTPEERERELQAALKILRRNPGFAEFKVG